MVQENLLHAEIVRKGYSLPTFAKKLGIAKTTFYRKIRGEGEFSRLEIQRISELLELSKDQIFEIFFGQDVS